MINAAAALRFLELLELEGEFTFQTFPDNASATAPPRVHHGRFAEHEVVLARANEFGAGVFVMANAGDGVIRPGSKTCRTAENVLQVRALFVDLDGAPIKPVLTSGLPPDWIVQSSPGRWHAYWKIEDCALEDFPLAQAALAARFNGDPAVKDLPRVMRVPGFVHRKSTPFVSELYVPEDYGRLLEVSNA